MKKGIMLMYCKNCGKEVYGKYCSNCGAKVAPSKLRTIIKCCFTALLFWLVICFFKGTVYPQNNYSIFEHILCFGFAALFAWVIYILWRKKKHSVKKVPCQGTPTNSVQSKADISPTSENLLPRPDIVLTTASQSQLIAPTYIKSDNTASRIDEKLITNENSIFNKADYQHTMKTEQERPKLSARDEELQFQFMMNHGAESQKRCDKFENLNRLAFDETNIDKKLQMLQQTIEAFEAAKQWHYKYSKGAKLYFQEFYEQLYSSRNSCFSWIDSVQEELEIQIYKRDEIIPWIIENAKAGFLQTVIYKEFPEYDKNSLRKTIDELANQFIITKSKKGNSYFITLSLR